MAGTLTAGILGSLGGAGGGAGGVNETELTILRKLYAKEKEAGRISAPEQLAQLYPGMVQQMIGTPLWDEFLKKEEQAGPSASEVSRSRSISSTANLLGISEEEAASIVDAPGVLEGALLRGLLGGGGGGTGRTEFESERGLREAQTAEIYARIANEPMEQYLKRLSVAISGGNLQRQIAADLFQREYDRARLIQQAPGQAAEAIKTLGGMAVPTGYTYPLTGAQTEPQPFAPFVQALEQNAMNLPTEYSQMGPDPNVMAQLAQQAAQIAQQGPPQ